MLRVINFLSVLIFSEISSAGYYTNISGVVTQLLAYPSGLVLIKLQNQPGSHPHCRNEYFALDPEAGEAAIGRMYARILTSYTTGQPINIGYDDGRSEVDCINNYIHVHRAG